jgi:hypothetical protein
MPDRREIGKFGLQVKPGVRRTRTLANPAPAGMSRRMPAKGRRAGASRAPPRAGARLQSTRTFGHSTGTVASVFRSGRPNGADSISNVSPGLVATPSENDSVAVPK